MSVSVSYLINFYDEIYTGTTFGTLGVRDRAHTRARTRGYGRIRGRVLVSRFLTHTNLHNTDTCSYHI